MTAAERFVKRMLGSISSSSYLNPNGAKGDKKWRDSALDVAIAYLNDPANDDVKPNVFSKRWAVKKNTEEGKSNGKNTAKTAQDSLYDALVADESPKDQTLEQHDKQHHPKGFNPETDTCKFRERITTETETDKGDILDSENGIENHKEKQFEIIKSTNPMTDDYHVGIRSIDDIKTFAEVCEEAPPANPDVTDDIISEAKKSGLITVYSSKPITNGTFVTPSQMMARDYAGGGEIYSKEVKLEDVAWISGDEGQYSQVGDSAKPTTLPKADKPQAKVYEGLSKKKTEEYGRLMAKKRPDLDADLILTELGKIQDRKVQECAFGWVMKGAIKLPEDTYKVEEAVKRGEEAFNAFTGAKKTMEASETTIDNARKALEDAEASGDERKIERAQQRLKNAKKRIGIAKDTIERYGNVSFNPSDYDTPMEMIEAMHDFKESEKPITVDELKKNPLMSNYRDEGYGVETFQVEDSREGQALMRKVIDTHWGKDANPWCLLHGDGEGNLSDGSDGGYDAWYFWNDYNKLPKRVAFKDGKLLAFMATAKDRHSAREELKQEWRLSDDSRPFEEWIVSCPQERRDGVLWWDRQDKWSYGIPVGVERVKDDQLGRLAQYEILGGEKVMKKGQDLFIGIKGIPGYKVWYGDSDKIKAHTDSTGGTLNYSTYGGIRSYTINANGKSYDIGIESDEDGFYLGRTTITLPNDSWARIIFDGEELDTRLSALPDEDSELSAEEVIEKYLPTIIRNFNRIKGELEGGENHVYDELISSFLGENYVEDADTLPQGETLEEHDRKHHKGHFDPSTQTCKFRDEMKKETDADKADIADEDRESKGNKKGRDEHSQPLVSPEEDKAYMEAVERGDMETAAKMVREVAERNGFGTFGLHGTKKEFTVFDKKRIGSSNDEGWLGRGFYFWDGSNRVYAGQYANGGKVMEVMLSMQEPYFIEQDEMNRLIDAADRHDVETLEKFTQDVKNNGYDSVVDNNGQMMVFEPSQIKSADSVTYDDDGNVIPLSRRFDDGDDIRGDVSGSSPSESNGEEFGESFYASVYPDRDESFSAEFAPAMEEESRKADESYAANFSKDGTYKLPFANGRFGKGIMDKVREEQKKQAEEAKRQEEEQKRQAETEQTIFENITKGMESISAEDAQEYISGLFTTLKDCGEVQRKAENRLARYPKKRKQETLRFVAATLKDILPRYPKVADALAHFAFYPCRPRSSDSYAAVTRVLYKDSGRVELKGQFMAFPYTHREQDELSFDSDGGKHMAWCIDNYPTNDVMANRACFMHEVGHLLMNGERYEDKENNEVAWGKIVNEGRREMEKWDSNISLYPQTCDTGRTRLIELHSECVALFTMPGYGQDSNLPKLPKCVEEYLRKELIG